MRVCDRSGSVLRTGPGEIRVKSVTEGYLFSMGSYPLSGHQRLALRCELVGGITQLIGTPVADALAKAMLSVQQYLCRAARGIRGGIHMSAEIHRKVVAEAVA